MSEKRQLPLVKKATMKAAGQVFGSPRLYRAAISATGMAIEGLPRFAIYNWFNKWGRQREVPDAPEATFRAWYLKNRGGR